MKVDQVIIGGGLVGSLLAITLAKAGLKNIVVFEKNSEKSSKQGRSINLIISAKGAQALKEVDIFEQVKDLTTPVYGRMIHLDTRGKPQGEKDSFFSPYGLDEKEYNLSISRYDLNQRLKKIATELGVIFYHDHYLDEIDFKGQKVILKHHTNSVIVDYQKLWACDGANSQVRKEWQSHTNCQVQKEMLDCVYKELSMPTNSEGKAPIDYSALHIWPRGNQFLMALPNLDQSFTMTLYYQDSKDSNDAKNAKDDNYKTYQSAIKHMPDFYEELETNPAGKLGTIRCDNWGDGEQVILLGDAVHAIVPFFGQGMNLGFSDCSLIYNLLKNPSQSISSFQKKQQANANAIADMAIENYYEMQDKVADQSFRIKKEMLEQLEAKFPEHFRSRYALVTFTLVPYYHCQKLGEIQNELLDLWLKQNKKVEDLKLEDIESITQYKEKHNLDFSSYSY